MNANTPAGSLKNPAIITRVSEMKKWSREAAKSGLSVGFVPTMGALHEGHASLIRRSRKKDDITVVSVFVNPTQFNDPKDLEKYPRTLEKDMALCAREGAAAVFAPPVEEMYKKDDRTTVEVHELTDVLCGLSRPGHFRGVCTVVAKLFNIVQPARAYFGEKDAQQLLVLTRMARDLMMDVEIVPCPIVRDPDGLAMSSRNARLSPEMRAEALVMASAMQEAKRKWNSGEKNPLQLCAWLMEEIQGKTTMVEIDYAQLVRQSDLMEVTEIETGIDYMLAIAVFVGSENPVRLIDNVFLMG